MGLYFLAGSVTLALLLFPHWRHALVWRWRQWWQGVRVRGQAIRGRAGRMPVKAWQATVPGMQGSRAGWTRRWPWALGGVVLLMLPVLITVGVGVWGTRTLEGFDDDIDPLNLQVTHLLQGEHLVPPPPLAPEVFMTTEVQVVRPLLASADRRWAQMDPEFVQRLLRVFKIMKEAHGYDMVLLEGWRSPERQAMLAKQGPHVTLAGAWQSYHQFGLGADCAFFRHGRLQISEKDPWARRGYQLYGQVAEQLGLTWGGRWQMLDLGHLEWRKPGVQAAMRAARER